MEKIDFPLRLKFEEFSSTGLTIAFPDGIYVLKDDLENQSFYNFYTDLLKIIPEEFEIDWLLKAYKYKDALVRFMQIEGKNRIFKETWDYYVYPHLNNLTVGKFMPKLCEDKNNNVYGYQFQQKNKTEENRLGAFFHIYYAEKPLITLPFILNSEDIFFTDDICIISDRVLKENKTYSKENISTSIKSVFQIRKVYFYEGEEKIINLFRYLGEDKILYSHYLQNSKLNQKIIDFIDKIKEEEDYLKFYNFYNEENKEIDFIILGKNIIIPFYEEKKKEINLNKDILKSMNLIENLNIIDFESEYFNYLLNNNLTLNSLISTY